MTKIIFPKEFWWGAATSGPQTEGRFKKKHANIFDYDFEKNPERFGMRLVLIWLVIFIMIFEKTLS